jgi:recombination protein RecT
MPRGVDVSRWLAITSAEIKGPELAKVEDVNSILIGIFQAAKMGLSLNKTMGEAYLVPFNVSQKQPDGSWKKLRIAQMMPGYKGLTKLARQAGVKDVRSTVVFKKDDFQCYEDESGVHFTLKPCMEEDRGGAVAVVASATLEDGSTTARLVRLPELLKTEKDALAKTQGKGPWVDHRDEMLAKTGIRRLCKHLPQREELAMAIRADEVWEDGVKQSEIPSELVQHGIVDASYQEVIDSQESSQSRTGGKPVVEMPQPSATQASHGEPNENSKRVKWEHAVTDAAIAAGVEDSIDEEIMAEFSIAGGLQSVSENDEEMVLKHFRGLPGVNK